MARVIVGQAGTISVPRDSKPTSATVTITRDRDSVAVVTAQVCTVEADRVLYVLAAQPSIANLTAVFTIDGESVTVPVQVTGGRACSESDVRRLKPLDDVNRYPSELVLRAIEELETALADACGVSFVKAEQTFRVDGTGTSELFVRARPQSITNIVVRDTLNATTWSAGDIADLRIDEEGGVLIRPTYTWERGRRNHTITGVFGYSSVPGIVRQAVTLGVRQMLIDSRVDPRATSVTNEDGTTAQLITAGVRGATFSLPELNQVVMQYRTTFGVA